MTQANYLKTTATKALLYELSLSPTPGLVDRYNNGSHSDMNFYTFIDSSLALAPFFEKYAQAGTRYSDVKELFNELRLIGIDAEKAMFDATDGINTHKGANFSFALILGATSYIAPNKKTLTKEDTAKILNLCSDMTSGLVDHDFRNIKEKPYDKLTNGEKLYLEHGITGVRGEAGKGYPVLQEYLLPFLRSKLSKDRDLEVVLLRGLILLMTFVEDGNLIHRGGVDGWKLVRKEAKELHEKNLSDKAFTKALEEYDKVLIERNLSPGGSADLLAMGIYFMKLEGLI